MPLTPGSIINNRYRLERLLGQGGMGAVYRAFDNNLGKPAAIKENLDTTPDAQRQFNREAQLLSNLTHPNLPRVTDYFFIPGQGQYLVMDFVEGPDLGEIMDIQRAIPEAQAIAWADQVAAALGYLHAQTPPIIHRDVKPANIKVTTDGRAVLVDFGIAKVYDPRGQTTVGAKAVTPGYSPPEQYGQGRTDPRTDVYALGATLYALLTSLVPPDGVDRMTGQATLVPIRQANPNVTVRTAGVVERAMQLSADQRFQSIDEFRRALAGSAPPLGTTPVGQPTMVLPPESGPPFETAPRPPSRPPSRPAPPPARPAKRGGALGWVLGGVGGIVVGGILCVALGIGGLFALGLAFPAATETPGPTDTPEPTPTPEGPFVGEITFAEAVEGEANVPILPGTAFEFGPLEIFARFDYGNFAPGSTFRYQFYLDGNESVGDTLAWDAAPTGAYWVSVSNEYGVFTGHWELELYLDDVLMQSAAFDVIGPGGEVLLYDSFSDSSSGFASETGGGVEADYDLGAEEYYIELTETNIIWVAARPETYGDAVVEAVGKLAGGPRDTGFGVVCRYQDLSNFYYFSLGNDGLYVIAKRVDGDITGLTGGGKYQSSPVIQPDQEFYVIAGECSGSTLTMYVNGKFVDSVVDSAFFDGQAGIYAEDFQTAGSVVRFDNFTVYEIK